MTKTGVHIGNMYRRLAIEQRQREERQDQRQRHLTFPEKLTVSEQKPLLLGKIISMSFLYSLATKIKCPPKSRMGFFSEGNGGHWENHYYAFVYCTSCRCAANGYFDECDDLTHRGLYECQYPEDPAKFWEGLDPDQTE